MSFRNKKINQIPILPNLLFCCLNIVRKLIALRATKQGFVAVALLK
jgi:hypothetical protein